MFTDDLYFAIVLTTVAVGDPPRDSLHNESFLLVRASSEEEAERVAEERSRGEETTYANEDGEWVRWVHRRVSLVAIVEPSNDQLDDPTVRSAELAGRFFTDWAAYEALCASSSSDEARWSPELLDDDDVSHRRSPS